MGYCDSFYKASDFISDTGQYIGIDSINQRTAKRLSPKLQQLLLDTTRLVRAIDDANAGRTEKLRTPDFHHSILKIGYRLVDFSPLKGPRPECPLENLIHIGLTSFIMTISRGIDRRVGAAPHLILLIRETVHEISNKSIQIDQIDQICLWVLFIGANSVLRTQEDEAWVMPMAVQIIHTLNLRTWKDVRGVIGSYPWIGGVHDGIGQALWQKMGRLS